MQNGKNSNINQSKQAMEQVRRYRESEAGKSDAEKQRRSHTYRTSGGNPACTAKVQVHKDCTGLVIGRGGATVKKIAADFGVKVQGPKRGAKEQIFRISGPDQSSVNAAAGVIMEIHDKWSQKFAKRQAFEAERTRREKQRQSDWSRHIQDISGCEGEGWGTAGNATSWKRKKQQSSEKKASPKPVRRNRFEIPDSDDEEEDSRPAVSEPKALTGAWAKGAPKEEETRQMTFEESKAELAKLASTMKPVENWADACSDDED